MKRWFGHRLVNPTRRSARCYGLAFLLIGTVAIGNVTAATAAKGKLYLSVLTGGVYRLAYQYDGAANLAISAPQLIATLPRGGGIRSGPDGFVYVVAAGAVHRVNPDTGTFTSVTAANNANTASFDLAGQNLWAGWNDTPISSVPLAPLANGTPRTLTGDDPIASMIAFTPGHGVFYTTGGEFGGGNFGRIDLSTFVTQRALTNADATGVLYDRFSGQLIIAGLGRMKQVAPAAPSSIVSSRDDSATGENYLAFESDGRGHLFATRFGQVARIVMIDYSASSLIGAVDSVFLSVPVPGLSGLSGSVAVDAESIYRNGFEGPP